jgi:hypothetical protein
MTVDQFIKWLQSLNVPHAEVRAYDPNIQEDAPVTGAVYDEHNLVLHTDSDEGESEHPDDSDWQDDSVRKLQQ